MEAANPVRGHSRKGGRPDAAASIRLVEEILTAAEAIFLREGFGGAAIEAIAAASSTSKQTIYARFGSKERLFVAVSDRLLSERFAGEPPCRGSLRETLVAIADLMLGAMLDPKMVRMYSIVAAEAQRLPHLARLTDEDRTFPGRGMMLAVLTDAAAKGEIMCPDPRRAMMMLQNMVLGPPLRAAALHLDEPGIASARDWARLAVDMFLDGALPRGANSA